MKLTKQIRDTVHALKQYPLSDFDLSNMDEPSRIHRFNEVFQRINEGKLRSLDSLFDRLGRCILFLPTDSKMNTGHWACCLKQGSNLVLWESYAFPVKELFTKLNSQNSLHTQSFLEKAESEGYKVKQNKKRYQTLNKDNKACGRFCILRLMCHDKSQKEFDALLRKLKKEHKFTPLHVATILSFHEIGS